MVVKWEFTDLHALLLAGHGFLQLTMGCQVVEARIGWIARVHLLADFLVLFKSGAHVHFL